MFAARPYPRRGVVDNAPLESGPAGSDWSSFKTGQTPSTAARAVKAHPRLQTRGAVQQQAAHLDGFSLRALAAQITAAGTECGVTASIGIVTTSRTGSADALLAAADQLMYVAKPGCTAGSGDLA